jgi:beta-mannosidase
MYPGDEKFLQNVTEEVKESVKRLSRHPCVVLWCGNNEIDEGWINWGWQKQFAYSKEDSLKIRNDCKKLFEDIIPAIIKECDAEKTYWPSSPKFGWGRKESMLEGDSHYWGVWWGLEPFEVYNKKVGRFMSEYGFQGMPSIETLQRNCGEILDSACLKYYEKHPKGFQTINEYMKRDFRMPKTAIDYVYVSQLLQSRGLQIAIEAHRRNKPYCMGSLYWQFNDCWPGISWSAIDFNDNWKAAHYTVRNCFSNVILSVVEENDSLKVYVISDRATAAEGELNYQLMDLSGKTIWKNMKPVSIEANSSRIFFSLPLAELKAYNKNSIVFTCTLRGIGGNQLPAAYHYFASPKDLDLAKPKISMRWLSDDRIELSTDVLAKNLFLFCEDSVQFEDNFFDLLPGEMKIVNLKGATKKQSVIKIKSLADTY